MRKTTWVTIIILIAIITISYYAITLNGHVIENNFANCISEKATLYMQTGCFACVKQEQIFGESYQNLNVVNCAEQENYQECFVKNQIVYTPTWIINYKQHTGYKTLEELSKLTGCELKELKQNE